MNYYEHHLGDYVRDAAHLSMTEEGAYRRLLDQYYIREKHLPLELKECLKLARALSPADRKAVAYVLEQFFEKRADGWYQRRAEAVIAAYLEDEPFREEKRLNDKERKRRSRERRSKLFDDLRKHGVTAAFDASMGTLETLLSQARSRVTGTNGHGGQPGDGTASHSPSPNSHYPTKKQTPLPPLEKGAVTNRRSPKRADRDEAKAIYAQLLKSGGAERTDPRIDSAVRAIGGWSRIKMRSHFDESKILDDFCAAWQQSKQEAAA